MKGIFSKSWINFYGVFILILLITIGWGVFFYFISPTELVEKIGIQNSYLVAFFVATICGFSSITGTTFYVTIAALAHGGANPLLLGLAGGLGVCLSDFIFFFVISKGTHVIDKHWKKFGDFIKRLVTIMPNWLLCVFVFVYSAFFPVPNDILLVAIAFAHVPFRKIAPYLFAGDMVATFLLAHIAQ